MFRAIAYYIIGNNIVDEDIVSILSNISIDIKHIDKSDMLLDLYYLSGMLLMEKQESMN